MPQPKKGESEQHYISRAIPQILHEGTTDDPKQSAAIAYSMWRRRRAHRRGKKSVTWHDTKQTVASQRAGWQFSKNMGAAVSPAMSSIDSTLGGSLRAPFNFCDKPFHRRKLKRKPVAVDLKRNEPALVEPKSANALEEVDRRDRKSLGEGWSYKYASNTLQGYGLDLAFPGQPQYDEEALSITFPFAASHGRDRLGDFLHVGGIDTTKHQRNPCAYVDHGKWHQLPIGKTESPTGEYTVTIDKDRGLAIATVYLDRDETTANGKMARQVFSLFRQGILRAGSIGYRPLGSPRPLPPDPQTGTPKGLDLERTELLEVTLTGLPANGDAVRRAIDTGCEGKPWEPAIKSMLEDLAVS